ncbi:MAG: oligosaccharide flippase family protein, partial [Coprobacillus sp.]
MLKIDSKKSTLFKNTAFLYILTFSNYLFSFLTVPYQTRIFGQSIYGVIGFAASVSVYFQLILDFGFILSATEEVSKNKDDKRRLGQILKAVNISKTILMILSLIVLIVICMSVKTFRDEYMLHILYFVSIAVNCYMPDFLYRGLEDMKVITYRSVGVKFFFMLMIFVVLKDKTQYYLVPILSTIGSLGALFIVYHDLHKRVGIKSEKVTRSYVIETLKKSSMFFYSRIAGTVQGVTNTFILGMIYPGAAVVGLFSCSDKLITTARSAFGPISDSLYPYMIKHKDFKLV